MVTIRRINANSLEPYTVMHSGHHEDRISDFETDNSYRESRHYCMQGDLIVQSQSHQQFVG